MGLRSLARVGRYVTLASAAAAGAAVSVALPAQAQDQLTTSTAPRWLFVPSVTVTQGFTDNVLGTSTNRKSDFYTSISPGISVSGRGGRVSGNADYRLRYDQYYSNGDLSGFRHDFVGAGTAELIDDALFVEARGSFSRQAVSREDAITTGDRSIGRNEVDVLSYSISPYYRARFGGWADSELRYSLSQVYFFEPSNSSNNDPTLQDNNFSSDSTTHRVSGAVTSGSYFSRLLWRLGVDAANTKRDRGTFESRTVEAETDYVVNRTIKLIVQTGYDDFKDPTLTTDLSGPFLLGGFELTPGPRTKLRFTAGERRNGFLMAGNLSYLLTDRITFTANYTDTIETQQSSIVNNLDFITRDATGNFVDSRTGQVFSERDLAQLRLTDVAFRQQQLLASLSGQYDVNSFAVTFFRITREPQSDNLQDTTAFRAETVTGLNVTYARRLSPYLTGSVSASISQSDSESTDTTNDRIYRGSAALQYLFTEKLSGVLAISHITRDRQSDSNVNTTNSLFGGDLTENIVTATVVKRF